MSRQDLRDEFKETEGNPAVKRIRRLQRQARRRRMLKDVERAAVVITNPTEFAIALEFRLEMEAPVVVAKGRNLLAAQIREIALWQGIPLVSKSARRFLPNSMPWWRRFWQPSGGRRRGLRRHRHKRKPPRRGGVSRCLRMPLLLPRLSSRTPRPRKNRKAAWSGSCPSPLWA